MKKGLARKPKVNRAAAHARSREPERARARIVKPKTLASVIDSNISKLGCESAGCRAACDNLIRGKSSNLLPGDMNVTLNGDTGSYHVATARGGVGIAYTSKRTFDFPISPAGANPGAYDANGWLQWMPALAGFGDYESIIATTGTAASPPAYANSPTFGSAVTTGVNRLFPTANSPYSRNSVAGRHMCVVRHAKLIIEDVTTPVNERAGRLLTTVAHSVLDGQQFTAIEPRPSTRIYDLTLLEEEERIIVNVPMTGYVNGTLAGTAKPTFQNNPPDFVIGLGIWGVETGTILTITIEMEVAFFGDDIVPDCVFVADSALWNHAYGAWAQATAPYYSYTVAEAQERGEAFAAVSKAFTVNKVPTYVNHAVEEDLIEHGNHSVLDSIADAVDTATRMATGIVTVAGALGI